MMNKEDKEDKLIKKIANVDKKVFVQVIGNLNKTQKKKLKVRLQDKLKVINERQHLTENSHRRRYKGRFI